MEVICRWMHVALHILILKILIGFAEVDHYGFCKNAECSDPLGLGRTVARYSPPEKDKIHFSIGQKVSIFSTKAGLKEDLLGVEIDGKRGYVPKNLIQETHTYVKEDKLVPAKTKFVMESDDGEKNKSVEKTENSATEEDSTVKDVKNSIKDSKPISLPTGEDNSVDSSKNDERSKPEEKHSVEKDNLQSEKTSGPHDDSANSQTIPISETSSSSDSSQSDHVSPGESDSSSALNSQRVSETKETLDYSDTASDVSKTSKTSDHSGTASEVSKTSKTSDHSGTASEVSKTSETSDRSGTASEVSKTSEIPDHSGTASEVTKTTEISGPSLTAAKVTETTGVSTGVNDERRNGIQSSQSVPNEALTSTEDVVTKHFDSKTASTVLDSSMSTDVPEESTSQSSNEQLVDATKQLPILKSELINTLPNAVESIVANISEDLMEKYKEKVLQGTSSTLEEILERNSATMMDEMGATFAALEKQGIDNVSDVIANTTFDVESSEETTVEASKTQSSDIHGKFAAQKTRYSGFQGPPPYLHQPNKNQGSSFHGSVDHSTKNKNENSHVFGGHNHDGAFQESNHQADPVNDYVSAVQHNIGMPSAGDQVVTQDIDNNAAPSSVSDRQHFDVKTSVGSDHVHSWKTDSENVVQSTKSFEASSQSEFYVASQSVEDFPPVTSEAIFTSRHLNSESESPLKETSDEKPDISSGSSSYSFTSVFGVLNNTFEGIRSFTVVVISLLPEPLQSYLDDFHSKGVPPRATVFTVIISIPTILLFIAIIYIRERSKEKKLLVKLSTAEQKLFSTTTERDVLNEDCGKLKDKLATLQNDLGEEQKSVSVLQRKLEKSENSSQSSSIELRAQLKDLENQVEMKSDSIAALQTALEQCKETNMLLQRKVQEEEDTVSSISVQLQEFEEEARTLQKEKEDYTQRETSNKEKIMELDQSCDQLLEEAEVWNSRVNELTQQLQNEATCRKELESDVQSKDAEIESLKNLVHNFEEMQKLKDSEDSDETIIEEKLKEMLDASAVQVKLKKSEDERDTIVKSFEGERNRVMELEVELLEAKSESEKLKLNYNQALQDKTEAQTKLEVLSNYFKDKELQLQKELGVQEAVRQQKEEDASFATRRVNLIEEENSSYKYQVASLKQEIEETERNYKNQVALQEKKAHENWLAARAAERKLEDVKQEAAQLRQRLTLLEREQENWLNSSRDEIVRPVPKRPGGANGDIGSQDASRSKDGSSGSLPLPHEMIPPLRPPVLPLDRPLPPMRMPMMEPRGFPPPPLDPYFDFGPPLMPFPPQPWHARGPHPEPLHPLDRRTPSSYERGHMTPPRRHHSPVVTDRSEMERRSASPKEISSRGSHTSSPPHPLPRFHDIPPPPPGSYDFRPPPPPLNSRYPLPPPPRREFISQGPGPGPNRTDSRNSDMTTSTPRGTQQQLPPAQDRRNHQPSSRV